jgi:hypothetical protein
LLNLNASERNYAKIIQSEFFSKTITIDGVEVKIWNNFPKNIIYEWIKRWKVFRKVSSKEFYKNNYPNFYKHKYEPQLKDMELYSQKSSLCKKPEFWYWYFGFYEKQNIYPKLISQDL